MGGLGHSEVFSTWGIPSSSYMKSLGSHTITIQTLTTHGRIITSSNAYHKVTKWFFHHMNDMVSFKKYTRSLDTLELNVFIAFSLLITIREVCMLKFETSLLGVNNVIK
jgi:hypothetical protein